MKVKVDKSVIGREGCVLSKSIISDNIVVTQDKITGILVDEKGVTWLRFASGKWIHENHVCAPEEVEREKMAFQNKHDTATADK